MSGLFFTAAAWAAPDVQIEPFAQDRTLMHTRTTTIMGDTRYIAYDALEKRDKIPRQLGTFTSFSDACKTVIVNLSGYVVRQCAGKPPSNPWFDEGRDVAWMPVAYHQSGPGDSEGKTPIVAKWLRVRRINRYAADFIDPVPGYISKVERSNFEQYGDEKHPLRFVNRPSYDTSNAFARENNDIRLAIANVRIPDVPPGTCIMPWDLPGEHPHTPRTPGGPRVLTDVKVTTASAPAHVTTSPAPAPALIKVTTKAAPAPVPKTPKSPQVAEVEEEEDEVDALLLSIRKLLITADIDQLRAVTQIVTDLQSAVTIASICKGQTCVVQGCTPQYLNGCVGVVTLIAGDKVTIKLHKPVVRKGGRFNDATILTVPIKCLTLTA